MITGICICCDTVTAIFQTFPSTPNEFPCGYGQFLSSIWKPFWFWGNQISPRSPRLSMGSLIVLKKLIAKHSTPTHHPSTSPNPPLPQGKQSLWPTKDLGLPVWLTLSPGAHTQALIRGSQSVLRLFMSHAGNQAAPLFALPCHGSLPCHGQESEADTPHSKCSPP